MVAAKPLRNENIVAIRAIRTYLDLPAVTAWVLSNGGDMVYGQVDPGPAYGLVKTPDGWRPVEIGQYVVRDADGAFYVARRVTVEEATSDA